jgi:hypothetical protein
MERYGWISTPAVSGARRKRGRDILTFVALGLAIVVGLGACAGVPKDSGLARAQSRTWTGPGYYGGPPPGWR